MVRCNVGRPLVEELNVEDHKQKKLECSRRLRAENLNVVQPNKKTNKVGVSFPLDMAAVFFNVLKESVTSCVYWQKSIMAQISSAIERWKKNGGKGLIH